jgi:hypothetical protein
MTKKKLQDKKKKRRERESKAVVAKRRDAMRKQAKQQREINKIAKATEPKMTPYVGPEKRELFEQRKQERAIEQLKRNQQILQAMEDEYLREQATRKEINEKLESEGCETIKQKMDALEAQTKEYLKSNPQIETHTGEEESNVD